MTDEELRLTPEGRAKLLFLGAVRQLATFGGLSRQNLGILQDAEEAVAAAIREAVAAERERCAGIADRLASVAAGWASEHTEAGDPPGVWVRTSAEFIATRIRKGFSP